MNYIEFDHNNFFTVKKFFSDGSARLLIAEPGPSSYERQGVQSINDFWMHLWDVPIFDRKLGPFGPSFHVNRGSIKKHGEDWQTGYENDREYLLRLIPDKSGDSTWDESRMLSDRLTFQDYEFKIGFQSIVGRGLAKKGGLNFCIPRDVSVRFAFETALYTLSGRLNYSIADKNKKITPINPNILPRIVNYAMQDLESRRVLNLNIQAEVIADFMVYPNKKVIEDN